MILATHAIVGAAAGRLFNNPLLSFTAGFASHFVIDAIPHSEYKLSSKVNDPHDYLVDDMVMDHRFVGDIIKIGLDCIGGFILALFIFQGGLGYNAATISILAGALGGVFPDFLQFAYFKFKHQPLISIQKFHHFVHTKKRLQGAVSIISQIGVAVVAILISKLIMK